MTENDKNFWLDGEDGLKPYLRLKDKGMPKGKVEQIAWLLLNGSGCGFCKVCRDEPCNIKDGEGCTGNIAKYIKETVLNEIESELQQYRAIGTVEECRAAMERQREKKPNKRADTHTDLVRYYYCPVCGRYFGQAGVHSVICFNTPKYCICGQAIDWSDEN